MDGQHQEKSTLFIERLRGKGTELIIETCLEPGEGWYYRVRGRHGQFAECLVPLPTRQRALREARYMIRRAGMDRVPRADNDGPATFSTEVVDPRKRR